MSNIIPVISIFPKKGANDFFIVSIPLAYIPIEELNKIFNKDLTKMYGGIKIKKNKLCR